MDTTSATMLSSNTAAVSQPSPDGDANKEDDVLKESDDGEKSNKGEDEEEAVDTDSVKGIFGWETVDETSIPYILRRKRKFVSVRIVERKLLSKYPNTFPDELAKKDPLVSHFITEPEAALFNEINTTHCDFEYGHNPFTVKDLIVDVEEFEEFFKIVKKTFPADVLAKINDEVATTSSQGPKGSPVSPTVPQAPEPDISQYCGWLQINNTVSPYILRPDEMGKQVKLVPLSVIVYAAGLLAGAKVEGLLPMKQECSMLNKACRAAGFSFAFGKNTRLISIVEVLQRCQVQLIDLPFKNPLQYAKYLDPTTGQANPLLVAQAQMNESPNTQSSSRDSQPNAKCGVNPNPFVPTFQQGMMSLLPGLQQPPQRFPGMRIPVPQSSGPAMPPQVSEKVKDSRAPVPGMPPQAYWPPMMVRAGPPPAHMGRKSSMSSSKSPGVSPDVLPPALSSFLPTASLPANSMFAQKQPAGFPPDLLQAHHLFQVSSAATPVSMPHPASLAAQASAGVKPASEMPAIRYPPPRIGLPHRPPPYPSGPAALPFGINQFNSALFARSDQSEAASSHGKNRASPGASPTSPSASSRQQEAKSSHNNNSKSSSSSSNPSLHISAFIISGKSISCLQVGKGQRSGNFCLVEAVSKLYFPNVPLAEFVKVMEMVLQVRLYECTKEEEELFVQYYNLPVQQLKCTKMIRVEDLEKCFPQLSYMFTRCSKDAASAAAAAAVSSAAIAAAAVADPSLVSRHNQSYHGGPVKRSSLLSLGDEGGPSQAKHQPGVSSLEHVVQKLHQGRDPALSDVNPTSPVIVIDD